ncbi:hypothetical protein O7027_RS25990, partial [Escherichia coli]
HSVVLFAFSKFFQIFTFFNKNPDLDLSVYLRTSFVPYMPQDAPCKSHEQKARKNESSVTSGINFSVAFFICVGKVSSQ